ncbi:MAG: TonB-dependent receptor, partial [Methylococcales bacterium]|nr:TonB-dependent receptor [Methylococcales bacterium]
TFDFGLSADVDYTFTTGEQDSEKLDRMVGMTNTPEHMIKSNFLYNFDKFTARFTGRWFDKIRAHESNSMYKGGTMHGATIFDANLHYALQLKSAEWSLDLGVTNLLDTKYYTIDVNDSFVGDLPHLPQETRRVYFTVGLSF